LLKVGGYSLPMVPHVGHMCQIHQHRCFAHSVCGLLEYIPWLRDWMEVPARIEGGILHRPRDSGVTTQSWLQSIGTAWRAAIVVKCLIWEP
jgi:hypothetical protein